MDVKNKETESDQYRKEKNENDKEKYPVAGVTL